MANGSDLVIRIQQGSLTRSGLGGICGPIWCEFGTEAFPARGWNDFSIVVVSWWLEKVVDIVEGRKRKANVNFMDGPFLVHVVAKQPDMWQCEFIESTLIGPRLLHRFDFAPDPLISSLITCSELLLNECSANGWESTDIDSVIRHRERLIECVSKKHPSL